MTEIFMADRASGKCSIFTEASGGGDVSDPSSNRNRPLLDPVNWLQNIKFHSDFDYYQVAIGPTNVTVTHPTINGTSVTIVNTAGYTFTRQGQVVITDIDLVTHGLGYIPKYMVAYNDSLIGPGSLIQVDTNKIRTIAPYATTNKIILRDTGISSNTNLSSISRDYSVLVFREPEVDSDSLFEFDQSTGEVILGRGKFKSNLKMLRQAEPGDSPFDISLGRTIDIKNGGMKIVLADGTTFTESNYDGSFTGSPSIQCAVE